MKHPNYFRSGLSAVHAIAASGVSFGSSSKKNRFKKTHKKWIQKKRNRQIAKASRVRNGALK
jgi:hypothetical protein